MPESTAIIFLTSEPIMWPGIPCAKLLQSCLTLCNPMDCNLPGFSVHGILQAKDWSGLSCPSPGDLPHPGIKPMSFMSPALEDGFFTTRATWEAHFHLKVKVAQWCPTLCDPMDYTIHGILQARILKWVTIPSPGDLPNPGIKPRTPALQADSLPAEPQGKPKNTIVGSLSLLQQIFPTQELNQGILHCRWSYPTELSGKPSLIYGK